MTFGGAFVITNIQDTVTLHNGVKMPRFGLGVYKVEEGGQTVETVKTALDLGYRLIDTAAFYENEEGVGQAVRESGIQRDEIFVTTKVWNNDQGYDETLKAFDLSMQKLGLDFLDLYLVHWPVKGKYLETWRALERIYKEGRVKAIGVSNFQPHHLQDIMNHFDEKPTVNQIELHPLFSQETVRRFCADHDIKVEAWAPIARGKILDHSILKEIAEKHGKTTAQVVLRWHLQNEIIAIPKSVSANRIKENADIFNFVLTDSEMAEINSINKNERQGADPDNFDF